MSPLVGEKSVGRRDHLEEDAWDTVGVFVCPGALSSFSGSSRESGLSSPELH